MNEEIKPRKYKRHLDRVTLRGQSRDRLNDLTEQIKRQIPGIKLCREDVLEDIIMAQPLDVATDQMDRIREKYFDEVQFAQWAAQEIKEAHSRGEKLSLTDIVSGSYVPRPRKARKRKVAEHDATTQSSPIHDETHEEVNNPNSKEA